MDEATANVDPENEEKLMKAIDLLTKNKTVIMIPHRLKTVKNCDNIFVIDQGKIVQSGTHNELIKNDVVYINHLYQKEKKLLDGKYNIKLFIRKEEG